MRARSDDGPGRKAGKRNAARILTWMAASGLLVLLVGGSVAYLILFPPLNPNALTPEETVARAKTLEIAFTPEAMDAVSPQVDDATSAAMATLAGSREWNDRGDFSYLMRHGVEGDTADKLLDAYAKQVAAANVLFSEDKPVCLFNWRLSINADPSFAQALGMATQVASLQVLVDAKNDRADKAFERLKKWTSMLASWPKGLTPVEAVQRSFSMRQAILCVVRAAESRPHDDIFRQRLLKEVVEPLPMPDPRPVLRADASVTALFARQQAGLDGTEYPERLQAKFNAEWAFAPKPVRTQVLEAAQQEVLRQQVAVIEAVDKGWPGDPSAGEDLVSKTIDIVPRPSTVSPKDSYKNMLLSASVSLDQITRACRTVAVYRDLAAVFLRIEAFRDRHGQWPQTLEAAGVSTEDPYSGEPLHYRTDGAIKIWSVGADRVDDEGRARASLAGGQGDIVLSLDRYGHFQFAGN